MCAGISSLSAQTDATSLAISLSDSAFTVNNKDLKDVTVRVKNSSNERFTGYIKLHAGQGLRVVSKDSIRLSIRPQEESFFSAKIYVNQNAENRKMQATIDLHDAETNLLISRNVVFNLQASRMLNAIVERNSLIMPPMGEHLDIPVRISNKGNVKQAGTVVIAYPASLNDKSNKSVTVALEPSKDTVIVFSRKITRDMTRLGQMDISIRGIYPDGGIFCFQNISVQNLSSKRIYEQALEQILTHSNQITLGVQNAFGESESYLLRSNGLYDIKDGKIGYALNLNKLKYGDQSTIVNGTALYMEYKRLGLKAGNLSPSSGDLSFVGRGAEGAIFLDSVKKSKISVGFLDKNISLVSTGTKSISLGNTTWAALKTVSGYTINTGTIAYDFDNTTHSRNYMLVDNLGFRLAENFNTEVKVGVGHSLSTISDESHNALSGSVIFSGLLFKNMIVNGNNSYASAYYAGSRRGTIYTNNGFTYKMGRSQLNGFISYSRSNPKYLNTPVSTFQNKNDNISTELTLAKRMGIFNVALGASYYVENGNWYANNVIEQGQMRSGRISNTISFNTLKSRQNLFMKTDLGSFTSTYDGGFNFQFRTAFNYSIRNLHISGNFLKGNFYLADVFQQHFAGTKAIRLTLSPSYSVYLFRKAVELDLGTTYNRDYYGTSYFANTSLVYTTSFASFYSNFQYNIYNGGRKYRNLQLGVNYFLPDGSRKGQVYGGRINLFMFYDFNQDGIFNGADSAASGLMVHIGDVILKSDKSGNITYKKLPAKKYSIYFPTQGGWYSEDRFITLEEKETKTIAIPFVQTGAIHGSIRYEYDSTFSYSVEKDKAWQNVVATDLDGKRFETKTDENGNYHLFLPVGVYTITMTNLPDQIELVRSGNNKNRLEIDSAEVITDVNFILRIKQRRMEVKKFGQKK